MNLDDINMTDHVADKIKQSVIQVAVSTCSNKKGSQAEYIVASRELKQKGLSLCTGNSVPYVIIQE